MLSALVVRPRRPSAQKLDWRTDPNPLLELLAGDLDTGRRNNELVVALLDDIAVYLFGDLPQFVDYLFDRSVFGAVACDIGDNEIAVVDGVLDRNHVLSTRHRWRGTRRPHRSCPNPTRRNPRRFAGRCRRESYS